MDELPKSTMKAAWQRELLWFGAVLGAGYGVGWLFDLAADGVLVAATLYLLYSLRLLWTLSRWTEQPKAVELPDSGGVWGEVFEQLLELQKRNKKRKKKLSSILSEFQASTAALPDGAVVLRGRGEIAWFNKAAQALLGLRVATDIGQRIPNLVRSPAFTEYFAAGNFDGDVELTSPVNEQVTLAVRIIPYGDQQRLMIVRDVSELRRLDQMRRDFVANASHELRTPLTVLRGYLDMMEPETRSAGPLAPWRAPLSEMRAQAARMESLINDLLRLARLESEVVSQRQDIIDAPETLAQALDSARSLSQGQHEITADVDGALDLFGRESEFESVAANLLANAVQYTPKGGRITLRWWGDDDGAHLAVSDSGIGIEAKEIPRLTERFYRVDVGRSRARGGTGLGLAIVKHVMERHEGKLEITSEPGQGSTFTCHFPQHRAHARAALAASA